MALTSLGSYLMLTAAQKLTLTLRMSLLGRLDSLSTEYYEDTPVGTVMYPLKEPIEEVAYFGSDLMPAILRMFLTTSFTAESDHNKTYLPPAFGLRYGVPWQLFWPCALSLATATRWCCQEA